MRSKQFHFSRKREKLGGGPSWLLLSALPLAHNARSDIQMSGEHRLADGCFRPNP
jgi:hypothetical protein